MKKRKIKPGVNQTPQVVSEYSVNGTLNPSVIPADFKGGKLYKPERSGNYSGQGYNLMEGPLTEAERWDMPFVNPVFEYESHTEA